MKNLLGQIWERRLPHLLGLYLAGTWGAINFLSWVTERYGISPTWESLVFFVSLALLPSVLTVGWFHGRTGKQEIPRAEIGVVVANLLVAGWVGWTVVSNSEAGLGRVEASSSYQRQLTYLGTATQAVFSPDGEKLAFIATDSLHSHLLLLAHDNPRLLDTLLSRPSGTLSRLSWAGSRELALFAVPESWISVHPETGEIQRVSGSAFYSRSPGGNWIAESGVSGPTIRVTARTPEGRARVQTIGLKDYGPGTWIQGFLWSPAGPFLVIERNGPDGALLDLVNATAGQSWPLVERGGSSIRWFQWSEDGEALFFIQGDMLYQISVNPETGEPMGVAHEVAEVAEGSAILSPDGKDLVYIERVARSAVKWIDVSEVEDPESPRFTTLEPLGSAKGALSVSPDGRKLTFGDDAVGPAVNIFDVTDRSTTSVWMDAFPRTTSWSEDGRQIAASLGVSPGPGTLVRFPSTGSGPVDTLASPVSMGIGWCGNELILQQLPGNRDFLLYEEHSGAADTLFSGRSNGYMFSPVCSPDQSTILFGYNHYQGMGLWSVRIEDAKEEMILPSSSLGGVPWPLAWPPDDGRIFYYVRSEGPSCVYSIPEVGGMPEQIVCLPAFTTSVAMSRDGSKLATIETEAISDLWIHKNFLAGR
jgi:Tol biopolymer transport system component